MMALLNTLIERGQVHHCRLNAQGHVQHMSPTLLSTLGYEALPQSAHDLFTHHSCLELLAQFNPLPQAHLPETLELHFLTHDQCSYPVMATITVTEVADEQMSR